MTDMTIDLGVNFNDVKDMDKFPVLPVGTYPFVVIKIDSKQTGSGSKTPGRPMLEWTLQFMHPETNQKVPLRYNTVLPWLPPGQSELDVSGVGMLVSMCKGVGLPWAGTSINPQQYLGRSGTAAVSQRKRQMKDPNTGQWVDDPNGQPTNNIDSIIS